ncbi:MAG: apolipoprotein N-acyltransferase [Actinomycetota bacterium]
MSAHAPTTRLSLRIAAALLGGAACSLAFPPAELWPLAFVGLVPLLWGVRGVRPRVGALLGLSWGLSFFGATLYWIYQFGANAWVAVTLLCAAFVAVFGLVAPLLARPGRPWRGAFALAALWTWLEWARAGWPLGGFSWGSLGVSQADDRMLLPLAAVAGVWGLTFVVVLVNALLVEALVGEGTGWERASRTGGALLAVIAPMALGFPTASGPSVQIAAIQVDWRVPSGTSVAEQDLIVAERYLEQHRTLASMDERPDLALWGEGALDPVAASSPAVMEAVRNAVSSQGVPTVIGAVLDDPDGSQHTSTIAFDAAGEPAGRYDKTHLVPFGEYVPWRARLGFIDALERIPVDRIPGEEITVYHVDAVPAFATPICFENAFPGIVREAVLGGATFLVVPVNNVAYGFTAASDQHLQMSRIRAVETGRWVVDAAASGVSAFIDPSGRVRSRTGLFETAILQGRIATSTARTVYVRVGDVVPWLCLVIVMGSFLVPRRRTGNRPAPEPLPSAPRTLVILPTYMERATIEEVLARVLANPAQVDVLVVDDSSPDGTGDAVRAAGAEGRVRLRERPERSGLASAYLEGFEVALTEGYDLVVEMDSDLSHDPDELGALLRAAATYDLTIGSRYVPGGSVSNWSRFRVGLSRAGNTYARIMLAIPVQDATSGFRVYRRETLLELLREPIASEGYGFQVELAMRAHHMGFAIGEVPITFREREHGHSKISRSIVVEALWLVTRWGFSLRAGRGPVPETSRR